MKTIYFAVTNDLSFDQRMQRICTSLSKAGYDVRLIGIRKLASIPLTSRMYREYRLKMLAKRGKLFYAEYMFRLFCFLLFRKMDAVCAVDLDTIIPCYWISRLKRIPRVYDAHELFTGLIEVVRRPAILRTWLWVERNTVPKFKHGYTVNENIANELRRRYNVKYEVIRNIPPLNNNSFNHKREDFVLYQGAVNEGRGFEYLVPAMKKVKDALVICGDGNFMSRLQSLILENGLEEKIILKYMLAPEQLLQYNSKAKIGIGLVEKLGFNQYHSLGNKFFDYIHAELPQISMNYPEYKKINDEVEVAVLIDELDPEKIAAAINNLSGDDVLYARLQHNCRLAKQKLNWQEEERLLLRVYEHLFSS